jgi:hypothetical protein
MMVAVGLVAPQCANGEVSTKASAGLAKAGDYSIESVARDEKGQFALILRSHGEPEQLQTLLQPCRIVRVFGRQSGLSTTLDKIEVARASRLPMQLRVDGGGFRSVTRAQPCTLRVVSLTLRAPREIVVTTQPVVLPRVAK